MTNRIKTGIPGFDELIGGGFVQNSLNLLSGGTGTGKSTFCMQYLLEGAKTWNEKGIYFTFEQNPDDLKADAAQLGMHFENWDHMVKFIHVPLFEINDLHTILKKEIAEFGPKRIVLDSLTALAMPLEDDFEIRKQIFVIRDILKNANCTSLVISEIASDSGTWGDSVSKVSKYDSEEFLADSVIVLHYAGIGGESDRAIRVVKMRRTKHVRSPVPMAIEDKGIVIYKDKML